MPLSWDNRAEAMGLVGLGRRCLTMTATNHLRSSPRESLVPSLCHWDDQQGAAVTTE